MRIYTVSPTKNDKPSLDGLNHPKAGSKVLTARLRCNQITKSFSSWQAKKTVPVRVTSKQGGHWKT